MCFLYIVVHFYGIFIYSSWDYSGSKIDHIFLSEFQKSFKM